MLRSSTPSTPAPEESVSSPMSSPVRSVISYATRSSIASEPATPLSRVSSELVPVASTPTRPTTDKVAPPKAASDKAVSPTSATTIIGTVSVASASNATAPAPAPPPRIPLAPQLLSFFFENIQRLFQVPRTVDLSYNGFEVSFATDSVEWKNALHDALYEMRDDAEQQDRRVFALMPLPANAALHRYLKDLARVRMDLAALQADNKEEDPAVEQLMLCAKAEHDIAQSWIRRVGEAAGALSIADPAFSPRK